ncbi:hypothetical protein M0804_013137 [Polistes exclamans]|nr:hypothetical protein M0804_013137 [Polistes exclamans]
MLATRMKKKRLKDSCLKQFVVHKTNGAPAVDLRKAVSRISFRKQRFPRKIHRKRGGRTQEFNRRETEMDRWLARSCDTNQATGWAPGSLDRRKRKSPNKI